MKYEENIKALSSIEPNFIGFIFYKKSKRYAKNLTIEKMENAQQKKIIRVGVFVNESLETIISIGKQYELELIQLHGDELPNYCNQVQKHFKVSKAFGVDEYFNFDKTQPYEPYCDYFLFDTKTNNYGGSGKKFDWSVLNNYAGQIPFFVAGGITPQDVVHLKAIQHPQFFGVDINSGFEIEPGLKNIEKIKTFKQQLGIIQK